jgi:hypothetical protein
VENKVGCEVLARSSPDGGFSRRSSPDGRYPHDGPRMHSLDQPATQVKKAVQAEK